MAPPLVTGERGRLRLLQLSTFTSNVDRFAIAPLLVAIGLDLQVPLVAAAAVASGYYLAYGLMQPVWGMISDRIGRVRVMRVALLGAALAGVVSVLAPNIVVLGVGRVIAGACFAAVIPSTLVYVGDVWPAETRQQPVSEILSASALGIALSTVGAGMLADLVGWRSVPALTAAAAGVLWVALARLPEPEREPATGSPLRSIGRVLRNRWGVLVLAIALVEGAVVLGVLTYLAPAAQSLGWSAGVAGLIAAAYGVGALGFSRVVRALVPRIPPAGMAAIGGVCLVAAWAVPVLGLNLVTLAVAGLLVGASWAFLHTTLQTWATDMVPQERATAVALFATSLFLGSAIGAGVAAPFAEAGAFGPLFTVSALVAVPVAAVAALGRHRYATRTA
ncbi:Predicted arabinose efflux permease, MFS family [Pseudonocardia thermophila]|uniref:Predicted arabinose efflux permease, MFS family n=1 Tax=Pseudonocardia thermophila TaxID=1848 RepID=A0A1M6Z0E0_PSETH|nr:MFS transporter [Pseudonocardia thermophila]SHL23978.1 Predicted arabinose efflux permease, MFS family [Pseudonocardia thermophila]